MVNCHDSFYKVLLMDLKFVFCHLQLEYRPLVPTNESVGFEESTLSFKCVELGLFKYKLKLKGTPPSACPNLSFEAPLGSSQKETFT